MPPTSHKSKHNTVGYTPLAPYSDEDDATFANNTLCPRYAENDPTSAPPSPASIESFDILDSIPWRRSYISLDGELENSRLRMHWRRQKIRTCVLVLLFGLMVLGASISAFMAVKHIQKSKS